MTNVVLFCGGRGSATIIEALLEQPDVELTLIVNAYDDGLSTGALRRFLPGMLGPSDFRKNISYLLDLAVPAKAAMRDILEYRFPEGTGEVDVVQYFEGLHNCLSTRPWDDLDNLLRAFLEYADEADEPFDYSDCALGNLIFAGAYLLTGTFNGGIRLLGDLFGLRAKLLNVSQGECCVLQALKEDGTFLPNEAAIVGEQSDVPIVSYYLVANPVTKEELAALPPTSTSGGTWLEHCHDYLTEREAKVELYPEAAKAIHEADMIIYGPGTQHSSLLPSYRIAKDALAASQAAVKALVVNLDHDHDIQGLDAADLVDRAVDSGAVITHVLCNVPEPERQDAMSPGCLLVRMRYQGAEVILDAFSNGPCHDGRAVVKALMASRPLHGYDIDGVLGSGVVPKKPYVVISGRTFAEHDEFSKGLIDGALAVYIRGRGPYGDHQDCGEFKAMMINYLGVTEFHEDRPEQMHIIHKRCPGVKIVSYDVGRPRSAR